MQQCEHAGAGHHHRFKPKHRVSQPPGAASCRPPPKRPPKVEQSSMLAGAGRARWGRGGRGDTRASRAARGFFFAAALLPHGLGPLSATIAF